MMASFFDHCGGFSHARSALLFLVTRIPRQEHRFDFHEQKQ